MRDMNNQISHPVERAERKQAMKTSTDIQGELDALIEQLKPMLTLRAKLEHDLGYAKSREFIAVNGIRREDVEFSDGHGEWFNTVWRFADWLRSHSTKNWAEWNTTIYRTSDLLAGRMPDMPARAGDLP